jgi:exopolysaccharide production protein ExoQ
MSATLATLIFAAGIIGLFYLNREPGLRTSKGLWIPVIWLLIIGSRAPSAWFKAPSQLSEGDIYLQGNPFERNIYSVLLVFALFVLIARRRKIGEALRGSAPILLFLAYCAVSLLWSDYPDVGLKRWTKLVGDVAMVLIVITDVDPIAAFDRLVTRVGFLIVPISILFIRYYPDLGRAYDAWGGEVRWTGVTTNKNTLGMVCMIVGLGELWRIVRAFRNKKGRSRIRATIVHGTIVVMAVYLLHVANSATSTTCFGLGAFLILAISFFKPARKPIAVWTLAIGIVSIAACAAFFNLAGLVEQLGRNADLTGRTDLWNYVLSQPVSRVFGAGYESFWLGSRLATIERLSGQAPNQAHDGYIEILVNLGWIGITLLAIIILNGFWRITRAVVRDPEINCRPLAYFVAALIYNFTEAAFKMNDPMWVFFVLAIVSVAKPATARSSQTFAVERIATVPRLESGAVRSLTRT